jgi:hypothetical protein
MEQRTAKKKIKIKKKRTEKKRKKESKLTFSKSILSP